MRRRHLRAALLFASAFLGAASAKATVVATGVVETSASSFGSSCARMDTGSVQCWGDNWFGQLGNGTIAPIAVAYPVVAFAAPVVDLSLGLSHACAVLQGGALQCWGGNDWLQIGLPASARWSTQPITIPGLANVAEVAAGNRHTCVRTASGQVLCFGDNGFGQLGDGTTNSSAAAVPVAGLPGPAMELTAGSVHTCVRLQNGEAWCWGANGGGELGNGTFEAASLPTRVQGLGQALASIRAGSHHSCAVTVSGTGKCWGMNRDGELGNGERVEAVPTPVDVLGLAGIAQLAPGGQFTCALLQTGAVKCWGGANYAGTLGDGSQVDSLVPVDVVGLGSGVRGISVGHTYTCVALTSGGARCWGLDIRGNLGNGVPNVVARTPTVVLAASICAGFVDVPPVAPECNALGWLRNRSITRGCLPYFFCPDAATSRVAMAALVERAGQSMTPVSHSIELDAGVLDLATRPVVCSSPDLPALAQDRMLQIDAVLSTVSASAVSLAIEPVVSVDGGSTWTAVINTPTAASLTTLLWGNVKSFVSLHVEAGTKLRVGLRIGPAGSESGTLAQSACRVFARFSNTNSMLGT